MTLVHRNMDPSEPLASLLTRTALTGGVDGRFRFSDQMYEAAFNVGLAHVGGEPAALEPRSEQLGMPYAGLRERHVCAASVLAGQAPFGLAMTDENDLHGVRRTG